MIKYIRRQQQKKKKKKKKKKKIKKKKKNKINTKTLNNHRRIAFERSVIKTKLAGLNRFYRILTPPSASAVVQNI